MITVLQYLINSPTFPFFYGQVSTLIISITPVLLQHELLEKKTPTISYQESFRIIIFSTRFQTIWESIILAWRSRTKYLINSTPLLESFDQNMYTHQCPVSPFSKDSSVPMKACEQILLFLTEIQKYFEYSNSKVQTKIMECPIAG